MQSLTSDLFPGDINRDRPARTNVATATGTWMLHAVVGVPPYKLRTR